MTARLFEPDFANDQYLISYLSVYKGLGHLEGNWVPDITKEEYKKGTRSGVWNSLKIKKRSWRNLISLKRET